jgi:hypothetical protein
VLPNRFDLIIEQGTTLKAWFAVKTPDGTVRDLVLDGYSTARLQVRDKPATQGGTVRLSLTTANGGIVLAKQTDADGRVWTGYLYASATTTGNLSGWGRGGYNMEIVKDGNPDEVITLLRGFATLEEEWTR